MTTPSLLFPTERSCPSPPFFSATRPFGDLPVLRHGGRWLLAADTATVPADHALAAELDRFAVAVAAANQAVAALPTYPGGR